MAYRNMAYWNSSETSITLSGLKRNGMSRSNVRGLVAFCKVFRSDRLTNLIPGYTTRSVSYTLSPPSSTPTDLQMFPFFPACLFSPPLFSLPFFPPPPPFLRVRSREFQGSKNRRKTREGMTRGRGILSCYSPPPPPLPSRSSTARSPM